jgi:uncharacterized protein YkwD
MKHRLWLYAAALLAALTLSQRFAPTSAAQEGGVSARAIDTPAQEALMLLRTNEARLQADLPPYTANAVLQRVARRHAAEIGRHENYSHVGLDGRSARKRVTDAGYATGFTGLRTGENFVARVSADEAFEWLMSDPPHKRNILNQSFREIGIGAAPTTWGGWVWVMDFGVHDGLAARPAASAPETATPWPGQGTPRATRPPAAALDTPPASVPTTAPPRAPGTPYGPPAPQPSPLPGSAGGDAGAITDPSAAPEESWGRQIARAMVLLLVGTFLLRAFLMSD